MDLSVVIPNYNGQHHLKDCLLSLSEQTNQNFEAVLVDNGSTDDSIEYANANFPRVKVIAHNINTGFAKAVNDGIKYSLAQNRKFTLLLNNDVYCDKNFIQEMLNGFVTDDTGSIACKMLNFYDRNIIDDAGDFIKRKGSPYARGHGEADKGQYDKQEYIFGPCAGAAMYRNEVFKKIGFFDEDFFAYYEDVDFSFRMQLAGFKCFYNPMAVVYHKRGATTSGARGFQTHLCERNLISMRIKNYPLTTLLKYEPYFILVRFRRYFYFWKHGSFKLMLKALKGFGEGILRIPASIAKRRKIQKLRKVSVNYIESLFD